MELVERYIYAVTQKVASAQKDDIAKELRGLIEDMLEEKTQGGAVTQRDIEAVLMELGSPKELAERYRGTKKHLIGPELFDSYLLVLKIVLVTAAIVVASVFVIQIIFDPTAILEHFIDFIISVVTGLPTAFGWTTIWFAIIERFSNITEKDLKFDEDWTPKDLPAIPQKGNIPRSEPIVGIIIYTVLLLFFTFSSNYFGVWLFQDGFTGTIPFINEDANVLFLLFIVIIFGFGILKEVMKIIYRRWNVQIVVFTLLLNTVALLAVIYIIMQPDFWNPDFMEQLVQHNVLTARSDAFRTVDTIWNGLTLWVPIIFAIGLVWDVVDGLFKVKKSRR